MKLDELLLIRKIIISKSQIQEPARLACKIRQILSILRHFRSVLKAKRYIVHPPSTVIICPVT